ncbi:hypothetical protein [Streptomyces sp. AK02-04a]|uniref:hypothetical protein n=1 Tax=Streptomyces sp. AK02-04a TaxID=3028649 RepID=UPI0039F5359C
MLLDVAVIEEPAAAEASLDPIRSRILAALAEPGSATELAVRLGLTRQLLTELPTNTPIQTVSATTNRDAALT